MGQALREGRAGAAERVIAGDLIRREPPIADDVERADVILLALIHGHIDQGFPARAVDDDRVAHDLQIDVPFARVMIGDPLRQVRGERVLVELALAPEEKPLGLRLHRGHDLSRRELGGAVHGDTGDRQPVSFVDPEREVDRVVLAGRRVDRDPRQIIAARLVQRIDARDGLGDQAWIDRLACSEVDLVANGLLAHALRADHRHVAEDLALFDGDGKHRFVVRRDRA